jgi:hypothetical protein
VKIIVVTPTLGSSRWLTETVASVAALPCDCRHVMVAPAAVVPALQAKFPRTMVLADSDQGMYAAINAGAAAWADWSAMTYINDDDLLLPRFAAVIRAVEPHAAQPFLAYGGVRLIDEAGRRLGSIPVSRFPAYNRALYAERLEPVFQHGTLVTRAAWERHGGFDPTFRLAGDSEWLARLCVAGVPARHVAGEVAAFRLRSGQLTKHRAAMQEERARVDAKLQLLTPRRSWRQRRARLVFRASNLAVYAERVAWHGWLSFNEVIERSGERS